MPRFALLEHRWEGVHWDLLLEVGEALRAWAIDVPIVPDADLPARALSDHRRIYLEYEGPISGNRGEVRRIDRGTYEVVEWIPGRVAVRLAGAQISGLVALRRDDMGGYAGAPERWVFRWGKVD